MSYQIRGTVMFFDAILFDLDDTLHDRNKSLLKFVDLFIARYSYAIGNKNIEKMKDIFVEIDFQGYRSRKEMFIELQNRISWGMKPNITDLIDFWNNEFPKCAVPMSNLFNVLDYFLEKNIKMGIVTNGSSYIQNTKINTLGLKKYMKAIIISDEVDIRKPEVDIFNIALSKIEAERETCLYVGDNPVNDIKGAINAGLIPVWLSGGKVWNEDTYTPRYIINKIYDLMDL